MKTPHKHAEIIKAWADGSEVQYKYCDDTQWYSAVSPTFSFDYEWRIKPEPKPDRVVTAWAFSDGGCMVGLRDSNIKFTFDGETGQLKAAEVL